MKNKTLLFGLLFLMAFVLIQTPIQAQKTNNKKTEKAENKKEKSGKEKKQATTKESTKRSSSSSYTRSTNKPFKTWSIEFGGGFTNPYTDIRYHDFFGTIDPLSEFQYGAQLRVTKMFNNALGLQAQFAYNRVQGVFDTLIPATSNRLHMANAGITEGIYFHNNVIQGSLNLYWNISNTFFNINKYRRAKLKHKKMKPRWFSFYGYTGIGFAIFDPHVMRLKDNMPTEAKDVFDHIKFETDRTTEVFIPATLGVKLKLSKTVDLGVEYGYNFLFSDKLDGLVYDHPGRLKTDAYAHGSIVATIKLGSKKNDKEHIEWINPIEPVLAEIGEVDALKRKVRLLTKDEDGDGVSDYFDKDTETPEGVAVGADGKALDTDGDGVPDYLDEELFTDKGAEVDEKGRAIDTDKDGVPDHKDLDNGSAPTDFVNFQGVAIQQGTATSNNEASPLKRMALPSVFFDTDKANIKKEYEDELFQMAMTVKLNPNLQFVLVGHCDERGSEEYNIALGKKRAEAIKQYLVENYKIKASRFRIVSKGRSENVTSTYNRNRRVDIFVVEE